MSKLVYACELEVRWRDLDAFNHVNNASYLGYVEEARVRWFRTLSADWANETAAPILAAITMNYRQPAGWPETVRVELLAERIGSKSLTLGHRISAASEYSRVYAEGNTVMVWVAAGGGSIPLPATVRAACGG